MYTSLDVVEYLLDSTGGGAQDSYHRAIRSAVFHAYRDLVTVRDWRWYETHDQIQIDQRYQVHTLPWGVQSVDAITISEPVGWEIMAKYVTPRDFQRIYDQDWNEVIDLIWTVAPSEISPDRYELRFLTGYGWVPGDATLTYRRRPKDLRLTGYEPTSRQGTIDWTGTEARGTGTDFNSHMLGAVIRVSGDSSYHPESLTGLHAYKDEGLIYQVANSTKLYAWSPMGGMNYLNTKFAVTDYLDIAPGMYSALLSGSELWLARLMGRSIESMFAIYNRDLRMAFESDAVAVLEGRERRFGCYYPFWYLRPGFDQGILGPGTGGPNEGGTCPLKPDISGGDADSEDTGEWTGAVSGGTAASQFTDCGDPK